MANNNDKKKYNKMEQVFQYINRNFVTVSNEDSKQATPVLQHVIEKITEKMKEVNPLYKSLYESILYGGSYYDGLKVGKPEEFDIDLKLVLPKLTAPKLCLSNQPGFVTIQMTGWAEFEKSSEFSKFKGLDAFKDENNFLLVSEVLKWIESTVTMALNQFGRVGNKAQIPYNGKNAEIAVRKSGPAMTALIKYGSLNLDVDLVAVFKLTADMWPPSPFRSLPDECSKKREFLIVPKTPKADVPKKDRCWRMSFQEQESILISGSNTCKPALRLIKKLRDTQNHKMISSYFIKTVFLHEIEKQDKGFWNAPLSYIFMHMLKTYRDYLETNKIPYYWNKNNNLLQYIDKITIDNFKNYLNRVIDAVDKKLEENPYIIGEYLCTSEECEQIKKDNFAFAKTKSNEQDDIQNSCIPENSSVNRLAVELKTSKVNNVDGSSTNETKKNNDEILKILTRIQADISQTNLNVKVALNKIILLEQSVQDLKNDNENFKTIFQNLQINKNGPTDANIESMAEKLDFLQKSVEDLKTENNILKTGLRQFVL